MPTTAARERFPDKLSTEQLVERLTPGTVITFGRPSILGCVARKPTNGRVEITSDSAGSFEITLEGVTGVVIPIAHADPDNG